jgi:serine/threonine protein kinase/tetratricopeptide (TPR) repeat protein
VTNPNPDPLVGRTVGQYQILARIGGGGMGVVYSARDARLSRTVALKFLPPQWSHDQTAKARFVREAQAASATNHPNICTIHDIETADDGQLFIVMAYYEGQTVKTRLESGRLPIEEALDLATQVADGLAKAHAQGVVHRDIKPGNVIVTDDGVRILDFGLAMFADALKLTVENAPLGTVAYMSPEQVRGQQADARADVWAAGAVLYEMLTGHPPFRGSHAEAIGYAVRNEQPTPIRAERPEVPEDVEQLVFRALHKEPGVRYASGRELARALRQVRGLSIPLDLRTQPLPAGDIRPPRRPRRRWRAWTGAAVIAVGSVITWLSWPVLRVPVAIVPVINHTGYPELDQYRLALTAELEDQLADISNIRVLPHQRLLEIVRAFQADGRDISGRDALHTIATQSRSRMIIVPILVRESNGWKMRLEFRDPQTAANAGVYETTPIVSALSKETVYRLTARLAPAIFAQFATHGPRRAAIAHRLWFDVLVGRAPAESPPRLRSLEAAKAFEDGVSANEQFEFAAARDAFAKAAELDPMNPIPLAWQSRLAALLRHDQDAMETAERARLLLKTDTRDLDRLFVEAVAAEAHREQATAAARYHALVAHQPDEPAWLIELGGYLDRQGETMGAVDAFHRALSIDDTLIRPHLELCRLYSPSRLNEATLARRHGERALESYRTIGHASGEAQARFCLTDVLRAGNEAERAEARKQARAALALMQALKYRFGLGRAYNYLSLVALADSNPAEAKTLLEQTLTEVRAVDNRFLEPRVLMNLGVANALLGRNEDALNYYRDSFQRFEALGSQQEAAWNQVNAAAILVYYGVDPAAGLRDAQNALSVFERLGDVHFAVFARRTIGQYYVVRGRPSEASLSFAEALTLARERELDTNVTLLTIDLARLAFESGRYAEARRLLTEVIPHATGSDAIQARIELARVLARLADFIAARRSLSEALAEIRKEREEGSLALLYEAMGEIEYESGHLSEARARFGEGAKFWNGSLPEPASVLARAYGGYVDALLGGSQGQIAVTASLDQAGRMRRVPLEMFCRILSARIAIQRRQFDAAIRTLSGITADQEQALGLEGRGQLHFWRARALVETRERGSAVSELNQAHQFVDQMVSLVPEPERSRVLKRADVRLLKGEESTARPLHD